MSQIDPDDYQIEGSSVLQDAANKAGKTATKKLAKKAVQGAATKAAAVAGSSIGLRVILGTAAVILILGMIVISLFILVSSGGEEAKPGGRGIGVGTYRNWV